MPLRTVARCNLNKWQTPLFSFDANGIYVYCKDCRREDGRRGTFHLISWGHVFELMLQATNLSIKRFLSMGQEERSTDGLGRALSGSDLVLTPVALHDSEPPAEQRADQRAELDGA